ncbi:MAG: discoidin domain-containing protein [Bacteroidales bacterium]|nr:discoidin domain-containing protein [Bacteroidales bacterium]
MKKYALFALLFLLAHAVTYACDTTRVADKSNWHVVYVDSEELTGEGAGNGNAIHCIDNDSSTFWHSEWQNHSYDYPHEIWIDLGDTLAINGFGFLTRNNNTRNGRIKDFVFYVTLDTLDWGDPQALGLLEYPQPNSGVQQSANVFFGAVRGRYVRLVGLSSVAGDKYAMIAELDIYCDTECEPSGQNNQVVYTEPVDRQLSTNPPFAVHAHASSGLPLTYEVVSGPATIADTIVTLTGEGGVVELRIVQEGDSAFYPAEAIITFEVINLMDYSPEVNLKLTAAYPVEMPSLMPYLLHTSTSIQEQEYLDVTSVQYSIDGGEFEDATFENGDFAYWWTPSDFGSHTIVVLATASNGNTTTETVTVQVTDEYNDRSEQTFDDAVIDAGTIGSQWYYGSYELPQFVAAYDSIQAHLYVTCPNVPGGCDDWDRLAWIQVKDPSGNWVELIRYITPYGKGCTHEIDVTDFASLLQGKVDMRMYIETWGTGGWQMDLVFEYFKGTPPYPYSYVEEMWQGTYNFGDPANLQPVDTVTVGIFHAAAAAHLRLVTTGHGWGDNNTGNAAEFYHAVHHLQVNGEDAFEQDLWTDCWPNPDGCNGQSGTYKYDRAGWCPGSIAKPFFYDVTNYLWMTPFQLSYIFQTSYQDLCHPHNPDCVSGTTCEDCNASYNPHYRVSCYLIRESNQPCVLGTDEPAHHALVDEIDFSVYPNPSHGQFRVTFTQPLRDLVCAIVTPDGKTLRTYFFDSAADAEAHLFNVSMLPKGVYFFQVYTRGGLDARKIIIQ